MTFNETWAAAEVNSDFERKSPPEPGIYEAELVGTRAFTSDAGDDYMSLTFEYDDGKSWDVLTGFKTVASASMAKRTAVQLGVTIDEISSLDELGDKLFEARGRKYRVEVKQNGQYRNTYVLGEHFTARPPSDFRPPEATTREMKVTELKPPVSITATDDIPF